MRLPARLSPDQLRLHLAAIRRGWKATRQAKGFRRMDDLVLTERVATAGSVIASEPCFEVTPAGLAYLAANPLPAEDGFGPEAA